MDLREQLKSLSEIFLARETDLTSPYVAQTIRLRPGDPKAKTERKVLRRYTSRRPLFRHHLSVDPERVQAAWSLLGTQTLGDAIVLDAELVSRVPSIGAIYRWTGVQQSGLMKANLFRHFVAILPGANVPDIRICAKSERLAIRYARDYLARIPETDWNREDIWMSPYSKPITDVTDVSINRYGNVLLHGRWLKIVWWRDGTGRALRPTCVWHQRADDGRWVKGNHQNDLERYHHWRDQQRAASAPPPIPDEDLEAFVL